MTTVIKVKNLSKKYLIGHEKQARYSTLRDSLSHGVKSMAHRIRHPLQTNTEGTELEEFWALKDLNFEIQQGDKVGIIGRNGAGKSTLLKILSRITTPTTGKITLKGRVASLLEVGTGFHPELSGRENIYLNGAILGMRKTEIKQKFDEIVAFAEVEKFLDTPVKRYSSGMYVRLAFAVAAHLQSEILIVDEILAVGDIQFQKKCFEKINEENNIEKTVIFVSHDLRTIRSLCNQGIYLENGRIIEASTSDKVTDLYLNSIQNRTNGYWYKKNSTLKPVYFEEICIRNESSNITNTIPSTQSFFIDIKIHSMREIENAQIHIRFTNSDGIPVLTTANIDYLKPHPIAKGKNKYRITIPPNFLQHGYYTLVFAVMIVNTQLFDEIKDEISFHIEDYCNHSTRYREGRKCVVTPIFEWTKLT